MSSMSRTSETSDKSSSSSSSSSRSKNSSTILKHFKPHQPAVSRSHHQRASRTMVFNPHDMPRSSGRAHSSHITTHRSSSLSPTELEVLMQAQQERRSANPAAQVAHELSPCPPVHPCITNSPTLRLATLPLFRKSLCLPLGMTHLDSVDEMDSLEERDSIRRIKARKRLFRSKQQEQEHELEQEMKRELDDIVGIEMTDGDEGDDTVDTLFGVPGQNNDIWERMKEFCVGVPLASARPDQMAGTKRKSLSKAAVILTTIGEETSEHRSETVLTVDQPNSSRDSFQELLDQCSSQPGIVILAENPHQSPGQDPLDRWDGISFLDARRVRPLRAQAGISRFL